MLINNDDFIIRPGKKDDLDELLELYNEYWYALAGMVKFTLEEFETFFSTPGFNLESSLQVVTTSLGEIVGSVLVIDLANPPIHPNVFGCVRKGYERNGIGTHLLEWAELRAREAIERCPDEAKVSMYVQASQSHEPTVQLFKKFSIIPVRFSWHMTKDLEEASPDPVWPDRIRIHTFKEISDLERILAAVDEAFEDHWGHIDRSGDAERMARFRHSIENDVDFDPSLWYLAMDGDEIAGVAFCSPKLGDDREMGYVDTLGVRDPWRRQGLGLALLHYTFGEFHKRGYKRVGLGVDTQNLSGATRLYEKAGMQVTQEFAVYEKELRPGVELSKQSA